MKLTFVPTLIRLAAAFVAVLLLTSQNVHAARKAKLPKGTYIVVNGAKLWFISEGSGDPLVIISGGPGVAHYLYPYFSKLGKNHRVIYLDSYGCGKSERAASPGLYTFQRHVDEIEGLRKALGYAKIDVFGHSYGGVVAQAVAIKYPSSVKRLILANTTYCAEMDQASLDHCNLLLKNHFPKVWNDLTSLRQRGVSPLSKEWGEVVGRIPDSFYYNADFSNNTQLLKEMTPEMWYTMYGQDADFTVGGEFKNFDFRPELQKLTMPVLIVAGRMDRIALPVWAEKYTDIIPHSRLVMFEKSGHNVFQEENAQMIDVIREFLK